PGPRGPWLNVVGVVGVVKQRGLDTDDTRMVMYLPNQQYSRMVMYIVARTATDPSSLAAPIEREVHALDEDATVYDVSAMERGLWTALSRRRFSTVMFGAFAILALILAAIGVYAVLSYMVNQSRPDIGVRLALGAQQKEIFTLVVGKGMTLATVGIAAGLACAIALTRVIASIIFEVSATDFLTFGIVAALLATVALTACWIPARRAMRVDPISVLRSE